jgi:hypothetical protein
MPRSNPLQQHEGYICRHKTPRLVNTRRAQRFSVSRAVLEITTASDCQSTAYRLIPAA